MPWNYILWIIIIGGIVTIIVFLTRNLRKSTGEIMGLDNNNDLLFGEFEDDDLVEEGELPGLTRGATGIRTGVIRQKDGGQAEDKYFVEEKNNRNFDDDVVLQGNQAGIRELILRTRLYCAFDIIPDVEFGEDDSDEMVMLKQATLKVRGMLGKVLGG